MEREIIRTDGIQCVKVEESLGIYQEGVMVLWCSVVEVNQH